jgi:hypothetical protein
MYRHIDPVGGYEGGIMSMTKHNNMYIGADVSDMFHYPKQNLFQEKYSQFSFLYLVIGKMIDVFQREKGEQRGGLG